MAKILLVAPYSRYISKRGGRQHDVMSEEPPLNLGYLASFVRQHGHAPRIIDLSIRPHTVGEFLASIADFKPDAVGITMNAGTYVSGLKLAALIKRNMPDVLVIAGGPQASFLWDEVLHGGNVDLVVMFEGEETLLEILNRLDGGSREWSEVQGVAFRDGDAVYATGARPLISSLDGIPFPARDLMELSCYLSPGAVITSRGCAGHCIFCAAPVISRGIVRNRSPENVLEELKVLIKEYGMKRINFSDDSLTTNASRVVRLCKLILDEPLTFEWSCESRVDTVDRDLLRLMREAGCRLIHFGVETGVPFIMRKIGKKYDLEAVEQVVSDACSAGLDVVCSFIIGLPDDTVQTIEETIKYARNLRTIGRKMGKRVITPFGILTPFPGTVIYEKSDKLGIHFLTKDWDRYNLHEPVIETKNLTSEQLRKYHVVANSEFDS